MSGERPATLAQIVAALSVTYTPVGVLIWLTAERRSGPRMTELLDNVRTEAVAELVRRLGDADPSDFAVEDLRNINSGASGTDGNQP